MIGKYLLIKNNRAKQTKTKQKCPEQKVVGVFLEEEAFDLALMIQIHILFSFVVVMSFHEDIYIYPKDDQTNKISKDPSFLNLNINEQTHSSIY